MPSGDCPAPYRFLKSEMLDKPLGEVVRNALGNVPDRCRIQVIVQMKNNLDADEGPQERS